MALSGSTLWRIHATVPRSRANGPGERFVVWTQGCTLGCAGCFNPETHLAGGVVCDVATVIHDVLATPGIEGVTVTGGEPLEQPVALAAFAAGISGAGLGVVVLTGFSRAEIAADPARTAAVACADLVIAGRYNQRLHLGAGLRGSSNKEIWDRTSRYSAAMLSAVPEIEVLIGRDGTVTVTGMVAAPDEGGQ